MMTGWNGGWMMVVVLLSTYQLAHQDSSNFAEIKRVTTVAKEQSFVD